MKTTTTAKPSVAAIIAAIRKTGSFSADGYSISYNGNEEKCEGGTGRVWIVKFGDSDVIEELHSMKAAAESILEVMP